MFTKIVIKNIGVFNKEVTFDFFANKRDSSFEESVRKVNDLSINKIVGVIAGNSCGKTTLMNTLTSVGEFLNFTFNKKMLNDFRKSSLYELLREDVANQYYDDYVQNHKQASLLFPNRNTDGNASIEIEMYIQSDNEDTTGFYTYHLEYDKNYLKTGVLKEELLFRKKYKSVKVKQLFSINGHYESEIGYKLVYRQNWREELKMNADVLQEFDNKMKYYETFFKHYIKDSSALGNFDLYDEHDAIEAIEKNEVFFEAIVKLTDECINSIRIEELDKRKKLWFNYGEYDIGYYMMSTGTRKLITIADSIYKVLKNDGVFIIDELDNSLNFELARNIVSIFQNIGSNVGGQLIFTTHNPELISSLRNDQIYLLQKNDLTVEAIKYSNFISPITNKRIRSDCSFVKAYKTDMIKNHPLLDISDEIKKYI